MGTVRRVKDVFNLFKSITPVQEIKQPCRPAKEFCRNDENVTKMDNGIRAKTEAEHTSAVGVDEVDNTRKM